MTRDQRETLIRYAITVGCGLLVGGYYLYTNDFLGQDLKNMFRLLSDACMLPGFLMVAAGLMIWLANEGTLDGVGFVLSRAIKFLFPFGRGTKDENYGQYVERQRKKKVTGYSFLFVVGACFLLLAAVFTVLFYQ